MEKNGKETYLVSGGRVPRVSSPKFNGLILYVGLRVPVTADSGVQGRRGMWIADSGFRAGLSAGFRGAFVVL